MSKRPRPLIDNGDGTHTVPLTKGMSAVIDSADAPLVERWCWTATVRSGRPLAMRLEGGRVFPLHEQVLGHPRDRGARVDFSDGSMLNCVRSNMEVLDDSGSWAKPRELQDLGYGLHLVPLTHGKFALIDSTESEWVALYNWTAVRKGEKWYAQRNANGKRIYMHRVVAGEGAEGVSVDHWNGDGLDNTRDNLRIANKSQNGCNRGAQRNSSSGLKGVTYHRDKGKWAARLTIRGAHHHLGYFATAEAAHAAYCEAAPRLHGEFARTG